MKRVKKQHYLPQFYLRNFADAKGGICVVDGNLDTPYIRSRVADVAQGRYYYDFRGDENQSLERILSLLESKFSQEFQIILDCAKKGLPLNKHSKEIIINFLKLQFLRSDWMRDKIPKEFILENFKPDYIDKADRLIHAYMIQQAMFTSMLDYLENYEMEIYTSHETLELFTSSFPLFFNHNGDIESLIKKLTDLSKSNNPSLDSNLFFPISSRYTVYIYKKEKPLGFQKDDWISSFITSGISWSKPRIYSREHPNSLQLYPLLKPLLKL